MRVGDREALIVTRLGVVTEATAREADVWVVIVDPDRPSVLTLLELTHHLEV